MATRSVTGGIGLPWARRARAIRETWGGGGLPTTLPTVTTSYGGASAAATWGPTVCPRVDLLACSTLRGGVSNVHLCYPAASPALHAVRNRLVIVHAGHSDSYIADRNPGTGGAYLTYRLLREGYHVLGVSMPTDGFNASQSFAKLDATPVTVTSHDFSVLVADGAKGLRFFVDGLIIALNSALATLGCPHTRQMSAVVGSCSQSPLSPGPPIAARSSHGMEPNTDAERRILVSTAATISTVQAPPESGKKGANPIHFEIQATDDANILLREKASFMLP
jgi:hypothetical protein